MTTIRHCPYCNNLMNHRAKQAKHCGSEECTRANKRINERRYQENLQKPRLIAIPPTKYCPRCEQTLPFTAFGRNRATHDGLQSYCKACRSQFQKRDDQQAKDKARKEAWYAERRDEMVLRSKKRYQEKREQIRAEQKVKYAALSPEERAERNQKTKAMHQARKEMVRRLCPCGRGYWVNPNDRRKWFCSHACKLEIRWRVCYDLVQAAKKIGVCLIPDTLEVAA